jgi:hypothetical protein
LAIGAGLGAFAGRLADYGIEDQFVKDLAAKLPPGRSAIVVVVSKGDQTKWLPKLVRSAAKSSRLRCPTNRRPGYEKHGKYGQRLIDHLQFRAADLLESFTTISYRAAVHLQSR